MVLWVSEQADTQVVRSGDRPLDDDFFTAFERLEQVGAALLVSLPHCAQKVAEVRANARHMYGPLQPDSC